MSMTKEAKKDAVEPEARRLRRELFTDEMLDQLMAATDERGLSLTGQGGFLPEMIKAVLERGMEAELTGHLGYDKGDPAGKGSGNSRNGSTPKTVSTEVGDIALDQPRDRNSTFASALVPKGARRLGGLEDMIISLYAGGMTIRDIQHHLASTLGTELSHETISKVTDAVAEEVTAWQTRPREAFDPQTPRRPSGPDRDEAHVPEPGRAHRRLGVDMDEVKHVWGSGSKPPRARSSGRRGAEARPAAGLKEVLTGPATSERLPEATRRPWRRRGQTCGCTDRDDDAVRVLDTTCEAVAAMLRPIYTAANEDAALMALATFADSKLGKKYPAAVASWENAWDRFTPFGVRASPAQGHLHHELDRVAELPAAQDHQEPRPLPQRRRRDQAPLVGDPHHREVLYARRKAGLPKGQPRAPASSSKARSSKAGKPPWANSPSSTPTASTPTSNPM